MSPRSLRRSPLRARLLCATVVALSIGAVGCFPDIPDVAVSGASSSASGATSASSSASSASASSSSSGCLPVDADASTKLAHVYPRRGPIVIDGQIDAAWDGQLVYESSHVTVGPDKLSGPKDLSRRFGLLWDAQALYLLVEVTDDVLVKDSPLLYDDDAIELFLDMLGTKTAKPSKEDLQYLARAKDQSFEEALQNDPQRLVGVEVASSTVANGWRIEMKIPWSATGFPQPTVGKTFGLDVAVDDDDDGGIRDTQLGWNGSDVNLFNQPGKWGDAQLETCP